MYLNRPGRPSYWSKRQEKLPSRKPIDLSQLILVPVTVSGLHTTLLTLSILVMLRHMFSIGGILAREATTGQDDSTKNRIRLQPAKETFQHKYINRRKRTTLAYRPRQNEILRPYPINFYQRPQCLMHKTKTRAKLRPETSKNENSFEKSMVHPIKCLGSPSTFSMFRRTKWRLFCIVVLLAEVLGNKQIRQDKL